MDLLAEGLHGHPLGLACRCCLGRSRFAVTLDLGTQLVLAVEPGPRDGGGLGEATETDWLAAGYKGPEGILRPSSFVL